MSLTDARRRYRRIALALTLLTLLALAAVAAVVTMVDPKERPGTGELLKWALSTLGVIGVALVKWAWKERQPRAEPSVTAAKSALAGLVNRQWTEEARILSLGDPEPIPVAWHLTGKRALMDHPHRIAPPQPVFSGCADDIRGLAAQFRGLRCRRLVITGGPGMGKTTLAVQLLLELIATRTDSEPVPVLLSVASWDTDRHRRLHDWLAVRLAADYPALNAAEYGGSGTPTALAAQGHILPVLDGLDELPAPARAQVIRALNSSLTDRDQVILTSRTTEFAAAVQAAGDVLTAAAVIVPVVLTPADAAAYLRTCLPPVSRHDWTGVLEAIRSGSAPGLASVVAAPLGLWLIRMVYVVPNADPAPLLGELGTDARTLRTHLLDRLTETLIRTRPPAGDQNDPFRPHRAWNPGQAYTWLSHLAALLNRHGTRDLAWWNLARHTTSPATRRRLRLAIGLVAAAMVGSALFFPEDDAGADEASSGLMFLSELVFTLVLPFSCGLVFVLKARNWFHEVPGSVGLPIRGLLRLIAVGLGMGLALLVVTLVAFALVFWFAFASETASESAEGIWFILFCLSLLGFLGGLMIVIVTRVKRMERSTPLVAAITPSSAWAADRSLLLARTVMAGLMAGSLCFMLGMVFGLLEGFEAEGYDRGSGIEHGIRYGLLTGLVGGLICGLIGGSLSGRHHAWLICAIVLRAGPPGYLPVRLMPFLDDMHRLGLLRTVGPIYQFRHAELQDHLAAAEEASLSTPTHASAGTGAGHGQRTGRPLTAQRSGH